MARLQSYSKRKVRAEDLLFMHPSLLTSGVFPGCFPPSHVLLVLLISFLVLWAVLVCLVKCSPHFQALVLILYSILDLEICASCSNTMFSCAIWVQLYKSLPSLEVISPTHLCKILVPCAWPCNPSIAKYVGIIVCLRLGSRPANIDSAQINALLRCSNCRPLFWLHSCKNWLLDRGVFAA